MANQLILYSTLGCHLCDEAALICEQLGLAVETIEICDDDALLEQFGHRIPVLAPAKNCPDNQTLSWPFDVPRVQTWFKQSLHGFPPFARE